MMRRPSQPLFPPDGLRYGTGIVAADEEHELVSIIRTLPLKEFEFRGYTGKRRVVSYGWHYSVADHTLRQAEPIPEFLLPLRERAAAFAGLEPSAFVHALVTEYSPGTPIGWHRDRPVFKDVIGVSLLSSCVFRLRHRVGTRWERYSLTLAPRSAYLLTGHVRDEWEHSIPEVTETRYSVTFRSVR